MPFSTDTSSQRVSSSACTCSLREQHILGKYLGQVFEPHNISFPPRSPTLQQIFRSTWHKAVTTKLCRTSEIREPHRCYFFRKPIQSRGRKGGYSPYLAPPHFTSRQNHSYFKCIVLFKNQTVLLCSSRSPHSWLTNMMAPPAIRSSLTTDTSAQLTLPDPGPIQETSHLRTANQ